MTIFSRRGIPLFPLPLGEVGRGALRRTTTMSAEDRRDTRRL